jgi:hypothetical protein
VPAPKALPVLNAASVLEENDAATLAANAATRTELESALGDVVDLASKFH